jgi:signal transduction histidine kinase
MSQPSPSAAPHLEAGTPSSWGGYALALVVLAGSLLLVVLSWRAARERELRAADAEFIVSAQQAVELMQRQLVNYDLTIRGGVALFGTVARPSPAQWRAFTEGLQLTARFPAIVGLGFAPYVSSVGLEGLQLEKRATEGRLFSVWPRGVREHYGPILYLEPSTAENIAAIGYDMYAEPVRRAAMDAARDGGMLQMTGEVRLVQDGPNEVPGVLIYAPVYRAGDVPRTAAARRLSMQGWVYIPFRMERFVDSALRPMRRTLKFRILDITSGPPRPLYADAGFEVGKAGLEDSNMPGMPAEYRHEIITEQYGRRWQFEFVSAVDFAAPRLQSLRITFLLALLAALLLSGFAWALASTRAQAQRIAARMTEAHRRSEAHVLALNRSLEARVATRTRELSEANRELEAFAASVSHDLRAPLRAIDGFSALLLEREGARLDDEGLGYLGRVRNAATRMGELIDALLKLARFGRMELKRERLNLGLIATEIAAELSAGDPGREVEVEVAPELFASGDPVLVRSMLQNLLAHAWKFSRGHDGARIEFGQSGVGGEFFVRDNGSGFDMQFAGKLFRPFQRLHSEEEFAGDGIGLASAKRIIERHGGTIRAEGRVGEGATFWFTLPDPPTE